MCGTTVKVAITTDRSAAQNRFLLKDADGNLIREFGPFEDNKRNEYTEEISVEDGRTYCIEVTDSYGDGLLDGEKGSLIVHSGDGKLIDQFYTITGYGVRSFFIVDSSTGISETVAGKGKRSFYTVGGVRTPDGKAGGLMIVRNGGTARKVITGK